eukprot:285760_1
MSTITFENDLALIKRFEDNQRSNASVASVTSYASRTNSKRAFRHSSKPTEYKKHIDALYKAYEHENGTENKPSEQQLQSLYTRMTNDPASTYCVIGLVPTDTGSVLKLTLAGCHIRMLIRGSRIDEAYTEMEMKIGEHGGGIALHHPESDVIAYQNDAGGIEYKNNGYNTKQIVKKIIKDLNPSKLIRSGKRYGNHNDNVNDKPPLQIQLLRSKPKNKQTTVTLDGVIVVDHKTPVKVPKVEFVDVDAIHQYFRNNGLKTPFKILCKDILDSKLKAIAKDMFKWKITEQGLQTTANMNGALILMTVVLMECLRGDGVFIGGVYCDDPSKKLHEFNRIHPRWTELIPPDVKQSFSTRGFIGEADNTYNLLYFIRIYIIYALQRGLLGQNSNVFGAMYQVYSTLKIPFWPNLLMRLYVDLKSYAKRFLRDVDRGRSASVKNIRKARSIFLKLSHLENDLSHPFAYVNRSLANGGTWEDCMEDTRTLSLMKCDPHSNCYDFKLF